jgi:LysM repeat protein
LITPGKLPRVQAEPRQPSFTIATTSGIKAVLPLAPLPSSHAGFGPSWETLGRGGRAGYLVPVDVQPKTWSATLTIAYPSDRQKSIDPLLQTLERIRASKDRVAISYSRPERGVWRVIDMTYDVTARAPGTNLPTQASLVLSLQQAVDIPTIIGPKRAPATSTKANPPAPVKTPKHPTHVVAKGETLVSISQAEYGDALHWRAIGDANKLTQATLKVGMRLKLPKA